MQQIPHIPRRAWRRRAMSLLLALVMILGLVPGLPAVESKASAHWADPYLSQMVEWGFIRPDQANNPDLALTRADFMAIVNRAYGYHEVGETPFEDVAENDWFYDDVGIAYTARYINGTSPTTASPRDPLTRETAATILGRNMMLEESPGEMLDFTDARQISSWAKGTIKSALEHYLVGGYDDGTFRPQRNVSWGEMASMLTSLVGTPLQEPGDYPLGGVFGNVTITSPDVTLRDTVISGDLYISGGVGLGGIKLENVTVLGRIIASGTGQSEGGGASILLRNVTADELLIDNLQDNFVTLQADGITDIGRTTVRTSAYIEDNTPDGMGLKYISIEGESYPEGEEPEGWEPMLVQLAGRIEEVVNRTPLSTVQVGSGTVAKLTVDETAVDSNVIIDRGAVVKELNLDTGTIVTGQGDIEHLVVNAPGCEVEMLPDKIDIRPGITAIIAGEEMDTVAAQESSMDPMILAGYPQAQDIIPTGLDAVFSTNKAGTIYWAVSAITDGSIGEDDLIKPPSYGNIAVSTGTLKIAKGNEETTAKVTGLTPGGSYYLSAVLVDARDQRSTVKVISFTTPDNTTPAFCSGYPYMSSVSRTNSMVVVMPNKDCKLYYALLPKGAAAPTENELKTSSVSGALGYGVRDVTKNVEDVFRVNDVILDEVTTYVLYLWLTDADGVNKGKIVSLTFTTDDETPPEFIVDPTVNKVQATSVGMTFRLNENGTVYWVAVPEGTLYPKPEPGTEYETAPLNSDYAKLQVASGMNIGSDGKAGSVSAKENADGTITVSGLQPEITYDFYYLAQDTAGNYSVTVKKITISTLDVNPPVITQSFELTSDPNDNTTRPTADSDIYLDINENVKYLGLNGGTSFRDLYDSVRSSNGTAQTEAINLWALNLYNAIQLHKVGETIDEIHQRGGDYPDTFTDDVTIDYTQAYITTNPNNSNGIRIVFPNTGLHLQSGGRYYFTVTGLYDLTGNQIKPDPIDFTIPTRRTEAIKNGHSLEPFDVAPPTVWFYTSNTTVGSRDLPTDRNSDGSLKGTTDENGVFEATKETMDLYFWIDPTSTSSTTTAISYDILLWSDAAQTDYSLYYRVLDPDNKESSRIDKDGAYPETYEYTDPNSDSGEPVKIENYLILPDDTTSYSGVTADENGWIWLGTNSTGNLPSSGWSARSLNTAFNGCDATNFPLLKNLDDHLKYEFIISLERFKGGSERSLWNEEINFQVDVVAGSSSDLAQMTSTLSMGRAYLETSYINKGLISYIGWWDQESQPTLELSQRWVSVGMPSFSSRTPTFSNFTHESVDLGVLLTSPGTIHYVVEEAKDANGLPVFEATRNITDEEKALIEAAIADPDNPLDDGIWYTKGETIYITFENLPDGVDAPPHSGSDPMPNWMKGTEDGTWAEDSDVDDPTGKNQISEERPDFSKVASFDQLWTSSAPVAHGSFSAGSSTAAIEQITGLSPNTDYYIYMVIDNDNESTSHGYIYHFKTEKTPRPMINITAIGDGTADVWTPNVDSAMQYILFEELNAWTIDILQQPFADYVDKTGTFVPDGLELPSCWGDKWTVPTNDSRGLVSLNSDPDKTVAANGFTVLDALRTTYSNGVATSSDNVANAYIPLGQDGEPTLYEGGYSVFDIYANSTVRDIVDRLIRSGENHGNAMIVAQGPWNYSLTEDERNLDLGIEAGTYVLLVAGQRKDQAQMADDPKIDYLRDSFKANIEVTKYDAAAPDLEEVSGVQVTNDTAYDNGYLTSGSDEYSFTILLKFDKVVYTEDGEALSAEDLEKAFLSTPEVDINVRRTSGGAGSLFTIEVEELKLRSGATLTLSNDKGNESIWNVSHVPADETLTITLSTPTVQTITENGRITTQELVTVTVKWGNTEVYSEQLISYSNSVAAPTDPDPGDGASLASLDDDVAANTTVKPTGLTVTRVSGATLSGTTLKLTSTALSSTLKASITPSGASGTITWTSSNTKVATVSASTGSQVTIKGVAAGTATITVAVKGTTISKSISVTVSPAVTISSFTANSDASTITKGTDGTYTWTRKSGTSCAATLKFTTGLSLDSSTTVTVTSSDTTAVSVGKVNTSGTTGQVQLTFGSMNSSGKVTITVTVGAVSQKFTVKLVGGDVNLFNS